jgi:LPXTG-motif cell wall-anchored protein
MIGATIFHESRVTLHSFASSFVRRATTGAGIVVLAAAVVVASAPIAAAAASIGLGEASSFSVLAGSTVTNTGSSTIDGNLGVSPGLAVIGFPPGQMVGAARIYKGATAAIPKSDLTTAYTIAEGLPSSSVPTELGGTFPVPGVYSGELGVLEITGDLVLDADGDSTAEWVFQASSSLTTAGSSRVVLLNGASACNVFWQVGSSATLGADSEMAGTVMALTSITATTGADISGRLLARNGAVTLDTNDITTPAGCVDVSTFPGVGGSTTSNDVVGAAGDGSDGLPLTGFDPTALVLLGFTSVGVGVALLRRSRRAALRGYLL